MVEKDSILQSIRSAIGYEPDCSDYDNEILPIINAYLARVIQAGVKPDVPFVEDENTTWQDFYGDDNHDCIYLRHLIKQYIVLKVQQLFDLGISENISSTRAKIADEMYFAIMMGVGEEEEN